MSKNEPNIYQTNIGCNWKLIHHTSRKSKLMKNIFGFGLKRVLDLECPTKELEIEIEHERGLESELES